MLNILSTPWLPLILALLGILLAGIIFWRIQRDVVEPGKAKNIAAAIHQGALVFLRQEYTYLLLFIVLVFLVLTFSITFATALAFVFGALCSMAAGFTGMYSAGFKFDF